MQLTVGATAVCLTSKTERQSNISNPNDLIRDRILRYLYSVHRNAKGPSGVAIGIRDLYDAMKGQGAKQADVVSNLDYLLQKGWVKKEVERHTFTTKRGTMQHGESKKYKISDIGIDKLEGGSVYRREEAFSRINITNIHGVTVIGTGNIVNTELTELSRNLSALEKAVLSSQSLSEEEKLNTIADLETIQAQVSKPKPTGSVIRTIWTSIERVLQAAEFTELVVKLSALVTQL